MKDGDTGAFDTLYGRYHHALYRNVMRVIRSSQETEDIVQEVFFTLWQKRLSLSAGRMIGGWLFTVSYHAAVSRIRAQQKEQAVLLDLSTETAQNDYALLEDRAALLEAAIGELSPQKKKVFILCKLEGKSYETVAEELGISRYTVNEYLKEAMFFVRQYVRQHPQYLDSAFLLFAFCGFLQ
jgi:RNA polymerase sigma-70 factor (ECF subfamily)